MSSVTRSGESKLKGGFRSEAGLYSQKAEGFDVFGGRSDAITERVENLRKNKQQNFRHFLTAKTTLETSREDVKTTLETSGEDVKTTLKKEWRRLITQLSFVF